MKFDSEMKVLDKGIEYTQVGGDELLSKASIKLFAIDKPSKLMVAKIRQKHKEKCYHYLKKKR